MNGRVVFSSPAIATVAGRLGERIAAITWRQWVVSIDVAFVAATAIARYLPDWVPRQLRLAPFNLSSEMNLAAWWSAICLLVVGFIAFELYRTRHDRTRLAWLIVAAIMLGLSLDEIGSLHERSGGLSRIIPMSALGGPILAYALLQLYRDAATRRAALLIGGAFVLFGSTAVQEYFEHRLDWPFWLTGIRAGVEEGTELAASFLCLLAVVPLRPAAPSSLLGVLPRPGLARGVTALLLAGLALHVVLSVYAARAGDLDERGNPAAWYPSAVYFLAFGALLWQSQGATGLSPAGRRVLAALMLAFSMASMYTFRGMLPGAAGAALLWNVFFLAQPALYLGACLWLFGRVPRRDLLLLGLAVAAWLAALLFEVTTAQFLLTGVVAYLIAARSIALSLEEEPVGATAERG